MSVRRRYALLGNVRLLGALLRALGRSLRRKGLFSSAATFRIYSAALLRCPPLESNKGGLM